MNYFRKPKNLIFIASAAAVIIVILALMFTRTAKAPESLSPNQNQIEITLNEYSDSGQSGKAILKEINGKVVVILTLKGHETSTPQPSHIHSGECPRIGPVLHSLNDVVNDQTETTLDTNLANLLSENEHLNINVHESYDDFNTYTACGNIK